MTTTLSTVFAIAVALAQDAPQASPAGIECHFVYEAADGLFVDVGSEAAIQAGQRGQLLFDGKFFAKVEVVRAATRNSLLRLLSARPAAMPNEGDRLTLILDRAPVNPADEPTRPTSPTLKDQRQAEPDVFVPLLTPQDMMREGATQVENLVHGRIELRQLYRAATESNVGDDYDYSITRLRSSGTLERIAATPWALEWNGDLSYRAGDGLKESRDFEEPRLEIYGVSLYRRFPDESSIRLGRFIPRELPAVGYLDGTQGEKVLGDHFRVGGMVGFKPTRDDLNMTGQEPTAVGYGTFELGDPGDLYYTGTAGALFSLFDGDMDRFAILAEQRAEIKQLSLMSTSEFDLDVGNAETYENFRLTRWDLIGSYPVTSFLDVRGGLDRFTLPDTEAERDLVDYGALDVEEFLEDGFWRYWIGSAQRLPWNLRFSEEVSYTDSDDSDDDIRWTVSLTRQGLFALRDASITLTVYNLLGDELEGWGGRVSGYFPLRGGKLAILPSFAYRYLTYDTKGATFFSIVDETFTVTEFAVRARWSISRAWSLSGGLSYTFTSEDSDGLLVDFGLTFRF